MSRAPALLLLPALLGPLLAPPLAAQDPAGTRASLAAEMRAALTDLLDAWYPRTVDGEHGGFLSRFDHQWHPQEPQEKMIVTQARHVWTTARAAQFLPDDERFLPMAAHGFAFLRDVMWDADHGGFFWLVSRDGTPRPGQDGQLMKQAYGNAFGIYALAAYYDVSRDPEALRLAQEAFRWLDGHAHDPLHGGYFQFLQRDGTPLREGYGDTPPKDQNSSIHLLEAFTELYLVWPDTVLRSRLAELLSLIRDTQTVEPGYLTLFSTADWRPVSYRDSAAAVREAHHHLDHVSFGHDVETAYLMLEAAEALGLDPDTTLRAGKRMVDHALRTGWDDSAGGFHDAGYYFPDRAGITIVRDTKNWWAQAEGLNTLLLMADHFPDDPLRYEEKFRTLWRYVDGNLIDHEHGGWYEGGLDRDPENRLRPKAHIWKAAYHDSRALMNVIRRLESSELPAPNPP
jgi:mannobiose 2-epimerase